MELLDVSSDVSRVEMCLQEMFPSVDTMSSSFKGDVIISDVAPVLTVLDSRENILPSAQSYHRVPNYSNGTRPPYSFLDLTIMAIQNYPNNEATVQEIYDFISTAFPFFRDNILHWRNSVRHNLTVRPCFERKVYEFKSDKRIVWRYTESFHEDECKSLIQHGMLTPPPTPSYQAKKSITLIPVDVFPLLTDEMQTPPPSTTPPVSPDSTSPSYLEPLPSSHITPPTNENGLPQFSDLWSMVSSRPTFEVLRSLHQPQKICDKQDCNCFNTMKGNSRKTAGFLTDPNITSPVVKDTELLELDKGLQQMELDEENNSPYTLKDYQQFVPINVTIKKDNLLPKWALKFPLMAQR